MKHFHHFYNRKYLGKFLICALFLSVSLFYTNRYLIYDSLKLTIDVSSAVSDKWEFFFDTGNGFNRYDSITNNFNSNKKIITVRFPAKNIQSFRIDTGTFPSEIYIDKICISSSREIVCWLPDEIVHHFHPSHDIGGFNSIESSFYIKSIGKDPFFYYTGHLPSVLDINYGSKKYVIMIGALILSLILFFNFERIYHFIKARHSVLLNIIDLSFLRNSKTSFYNYLGCLMFVFMIFTFWALIKPPNQSPDEIAHALKVASIHKHIWITPQNQIQINSRYYNPIIDFPLLHSVPFHYEKKFSKDDFNILKKFDWEQKNVEKVIFTSAYTYPNLYYIVIFILGESLRRIFNLSPFDAYYSYRLITAFFSSVIWTWLYYAMQFVSLSPVHKKLLFGTVICTPMLGFICSSINPDAFLIPLSNLFIIYSYRSIKWGKDIFVTLAILIVMLLVKPSALIVCPALCCAVGCMMITHDCRKLMIKRLLIIVAPAFTISYVSFYYWSKPLIFGTPVIMSAFDYIEDIFKRLFSFFIMYWGDLGWLDTRLTDPYYSVMAYLILVNGLMCLLYYRDFKSNDWGLYAFLFAIFFSLGTIAGEFIYLPLAGFSLQGRYFLPVAIGFSTFLLHRAYLFSAIFVIYLIFFNLYLICITLDRYFGFDFRVLLPL